MKHEGVIAGLACVLPAIKTHNNKRKTKNTHVHSPSSPLLRRKTQATMPEAQSVQVFGK
jgi:hypothetical protein